MPPTRRPYDSGARRAAALRNRAAVLTACRDLLLRDGYRATTIRAVAQGAGVSPETVYKTFGGKPGLLKALWDSTLAGDDEPVSMAERPALRGVWNTRDPHTKLRLYAAFVRGVHERTAPLSALLAQAGPEAGQILATGEAERLTGITAFLAHLADQGVLGPGAEPRRTADACWALTGPHLFTQLTAGRGWSADDYQDWLAGILAATLLRPS
ncbi:TetR/AcrR family transcriptional regulator [Streptomyces sp. NBC_00247]|uniref:TetR/AcrR family transcriptional regulator n=1 Tax=Streptomyces sp. NBC_00247 TaxID=2975689 RepID=UPI002E2D0EDB|nr:TetR/AcrR family transcriptional regulator [Streptomyces sp. NBC_00247]